jgi:hypothetical protein
MSVERARVRRRIDIPAGGDMLDGDRRGSCFDVGFSVVPGRAAKVPSPIELRGVLPWQSRVIRCLAQARG